ncbi:hypothetical protein CLV40_107284 [Actinokineospora auranticolor]|uniref:Uncharacterized protein n=1 Tax=Actinokineospora auranticolor TaxID=155976 RepID=A0A2S6GQT7_9PSEU|nr:hypothetical protein CLV40_107284 [Actinokineospora auranticolor]
MAAALLAATALAFVALGLARLSDSDAGVLGFPVGMGVIGLLGAVSVFVGLTRARIPVIVFTVLAAVAHTTFAFGGLPVWYRVASGILAAAHVYAAVLLLTKPAAEYLKGTT